MKILIILFALVGFSLITAGTLMPEIPAFILQEQLIFHKTDLGVTIPGEFTCDCVPMPPDCGPGTGNENCDSVPCDETIPLVGVPDSGGDYCSECNVGGEGQECNIDPNVAGFYFNTAEICGVPTTCPP